MKDIKEIKSFIRKRLKEIDESINVDEISTDYCDILDRGIMYGKFEGMLEVLKQIEGEEK